MFDSYRLIIMNIFHTISSYSIAGKVAVITGSFHGIDLIIARVCVWAKMSHIILVGSQESTLRTAKAYLKVIVDECGTSTRIYAHKADMTDIDQIASIFFRVRRSIGVPDILILCTPSQYSSKLVYEYTIEDIVRQLNLNERHKKGFIDNFLMPGTRKRKTLIDVSIVADDHLLNSVVSGQSSKPQSQFLAYELKENRGWYLTFNDILHNLVTTKRLGEKLDRRGQAWVSADMDPACRLALWRLPEKTASIPDTKLRDGTILQQAGMARILKEKARLMTIAPEHGGI